MFSFKWKKDAIFYFMLYLDCREPVGFESGALLNESISATSFYGKYHPRYARINAQHDNKEIAWCTNITSTQQSLTVN